MQRQVQSAGQHWVQAPSAGQHQVEAPNAGQPWVQAWNASSCQRFRRFPLWFQWALQQVLDQYLDCPMLPLQLEACHIFCMSRSGNFDMISEPGSCQCLKLIINNQYHTIKLPIIIDTGVPSYSHKVEFAFGIRRVVEIAGWGAGRWLGVFKLQCR